MKNRKIYNILLKLRETSSFIHLKQRFHFQRGNLDLEIEASMLVGLKISTGYTMTKSSPVWIGIAASHFQGELPVNFNDIVNIVKSLSLLHSTDI